MNVKCYARSIIKNTLFLLPLCGLGACELRGAPGGAQEEKIIEAEVFEIKASLPSRTITYYGFVEALRKAQVTSNVSGKVTKKLIAGGELVKKGDLLFQIEKEPYAYSLRVAKYEAEKERINLNNILKDYNRGEQLRLSKSISASESDLLATKKSISEAQLAVLEAKELKAKFDFDSAAVRSPIEGRVSFSRINVGDYSEAGATQFAEIIDDRAMYVQFSMPDSDFNKFKKGNPGDLLSVVETIVAAEGFASVSAKLNFGTESFQEQVGAITLRAEFINARGEYKDGQFVQVDLNVPLRPNTYVVPKKSVFFLNNESFVYVVQDNQTAKRVRVEIFEEVDQQFCVQAGLVLGDRVIVDNLAQLEDGIRIKQQVGATELAQQ